MVVVRNGSQQVLVGAQSVAVATNVDDVAVVKQAIDHCRRHNIVAKDVAPLLETLVGSKHRGSSFVTSAGKLEEQDRAVLAHGHVSDFIHNQQGGRVSRFSLRARPPDFFASMSDSTSWASVP